MPPQTPVMGIQLPSMRLTRDTLSGGVARQRDPDWAASTRARTVPHPSQPPSRRGGYNGTTDGRDCPGGFDYTQNLVDTGHALPGIHHFTPMCSLGKGGKMMHPGLVLPGRLATSQSLFPGRACGTGSALKEASYQMQIGAPRYQTHDSKSMSCCVHANFRKTRLNFNECIPEYVSENMAQYRRPSRQGRRVRDQGTSGARLEIWACNPLAIHSGSGRSGC